MAKKRRCQTQKTMSYTDPHVPSALGGLRCYACAQKLSQAQAWEVLQKSLAYTSQRPPRGQFKMAPVLVLSINQEWVADLVEMQWYGRQNGGVWYLLTMVDVLSKYAWVRPIKRKTGADVAKAFESIVAEGRRPQTLQTDQGKEFYNTMVQRWLKKEGMHHFSTLGDAKASIAERFNWTLKSRLYRYFTTANTTRYVDIVPSLVQQYNQDVHHSIGMAPRDVNASNEAEVWPRLYGYVAKTRRRGRLKVGDQVHLSECIKLFIKGYLPQWSEEVFKIQQVIQGPVLMFKVEEFGITPMRGTFYAEDLQKVTVDDDMLWWVEKVLKRQRGHRLVRWKG